MPAASFRAGGFDPSSPYLRVLPLCFAALCFFRMRPQASALTEQNRRTNSQVGNRYCAWCVEDSGPVAAAGAWTAWPFSGRHA